MNHPDWPAFVRAIVAEPEDDTPRLVAADFLEENGDPDRAAFIRVQVALARLEASDLRRSPEADALRKKERAFLGPRSETRLFWGMDACPELVRVPAARPASPLAGIHPAGAECLTWRRGFVDSVRCPAAEWLRHGAAVRKRNPVRWVALDECVLTGRDVWYAGLATMRGLVTVVLVDGRSETQEWLKGWLPGTEVLARFAR
ncbi:TIGR02996 domain-containing protein [Frigoriglobus tundricola]|uniref:Uncharacterized protein n=1 Tax=Frigoriglobus tundricola TaxID=2774151 RepID=A0A6M5YP74_9BACT|nr:TIGR02996 domain-containing protein [Frigoriglobus tundricola]QJW95795.1 hypothetical protein FTUN_3349 [Frigoriglobus tundricola]